MKAQAKKIVLVLAALLASFAAYLMVVESVPHLHGDLVEISIRPSLLGAVSRTMEFAGWAMLAFAAMLAGAAYCEFRKINFGRFPLIIIGALYLFLGISAVTHNANIHMFGYVAIGLLSLVAGLL